MFIHIFMNLGCENTSLLLDKLLSLLLMSPQHLSSLKFIGFLGHLITDSHDSTQINQKVNRKEKHRDKHFHPPLVNHGIVNNLQYQYRKTQQTQFNYEPPIYLHRKIPFTHRLKQTCYKQWCHRISLQRDTPSYCQNLSLSKNIFIIILKIKILSIFR